MTFEQRVKNDPSIAVDLLTALTAMQKAFNQLLPGVGYIACQDYQNINEAPILAARAITKAIGVDVKSAIKLIDATSCVILGREHKFSPVTHSCHVCGKNVDYTTP